MTVWYSTEVQRPGQLLAQCPLLCTGVLLPVMVASNRQNIPILPLVKHAIQSNVTISLVDLKEDNVEDYY